MHRIAFLNEQECNEIVINKVLEDCPVESEETKNAENTFGKDMNEIKAKTTRIKLHKVETTFYNQPKK